jgi:hypothetical protein
MGAARHGMVRCCSNLFFCMKHLQRRSLFFKLTMFQFIILCSFEHSPFDDFDCFFRSTQLVWDQRWPPSAAFSRRSLIERLRRVACPSGNSDFWRRDLGWFVMLGNWMKLESWWASSRLQGVCATSVAGDSWTITLMNTISIHTRMIRILVMLMSKMSGVVRRAAQRSRGDH